MCPYMRTRLTICLLSLIIGVVLTSSAGAARFHVATDGTRMSGVSTPGEWSAENCYATLAAACLSASLGDSILLAAESHALDEQVGMCSFLGNAELGFDSRTTIIACGPDAQMNVPHSLAAFTARGLTFRGDSAESDHAAFRLNDGLTGDGTIAFESCVFRDLTGSDLDGRGGSCIEGSGYVTGGIVTLDHCIFQDNETRGRGGAVFFSNGYQVSIDSCEFLNNSSKRGPDESNGLGGALAAASYARPVSVSCVNTLFSGNRSWGPGGAIFVDDGSLSLVECEISDSASAVEQTTHWSAGAGVMHRRNDGAHDEPVALLVEDCLFERNIGTIVDNPYAGDGGGILVRGSGGLMIDVTVRNTTFHDNYNSQGGGLYVGRYANAVVDHCHFLDNSVFMQGGATYKGGVFAENLGETAIYTYCEFVGNRAGVFHDGTDSTDFGRGGAFSTRFHTRAEFHNCTFFNNTVHGPVQDGDAVMLPNEGYVYDSDLQRCDFVNTVFYGTVGNSKQVLARQGSIGRIENCAFEAGEFDYAGATPVGTAYLAASPFTSESDLRPAEGSPLINAAQDEGQIHDLADAPVPNGSAPDIGAYEALFGYTAVDDPHPAPTGLRAWPNPSSGSVRFGLAGGDRPVTLEIYDIMGRKVRSLLIEPDIGGSGTTTWDGRDGQGRRQPAGTYLCRVRGERGTSSQRLVLVR